MFSIISRVARKLGLVAIHVTTVRQKSGSLYVTESQFSPGSLRVIESQFSPEAIVDVDVHISIPNQCQLSHSPDDKAQIFD
ncbi:hypothetical protein N7449_006226 [Penicillium cf. viridicatum]|uniref:Uncharacterized protein n=1 Tax=Penicillium cf. viridicatum TaxID=2972119 RepID=A0A9W9JGW2_9EURO|nr:hypothetical protein N7449_006226 [Penicillium cf. viridicatum]